MSDTIFPETQDRVVLFLDKDGEIFATLDILCWELIVDPDIPKRTRLRPFVVDKNRARGVTVYEYADTECFDLSKIGVRVRRRSDLDAFDDNL